MVHMHHNHGKSTVIFMVTWRHSFSNYILKHPFSALQEQTKICNGYAYVYVLLFLFTSCIVIHHLQSRSDVGTILHDYSFWQCAMNFTSESIPNGIGFGGKPRHFGLFLSAGFDQGHSFTSSTFTSPPLSNTSRFRPEVIECWGIQVKGSLDEKPELVKGTVLERFKEDRNMLKLIGMASASDWSQKNQNSRYLEILYRTFYGK